MTCEECEQILLESGNEPASEDWMLDVSVLNLAKTHTENCSACAAKMAEASRLNDSLDRLRLSDMQVEAPASIESQLLVEFRRRTAFRSPISFHRRLVWASGIALTLIAGLVFYSVHARSPITVQTHIPGHPAYQPPSLSFHTSEGPDRTSMGNHQAGADRPRPTSLRRKAQTNLTRRPHDQVRADALSPTKDELSLNGGGDVVRVTLPLSSLVAMGVPIYPEVSDRRVIADVTRDPFGAVISIHLVESKPSTN